jgi:hypothetical protein
LLLPQVGQYQILGSGFVELKDKCVLQTLHAHDQASFEAEVSATVNGRDVLRFLRIVAQDKYSATHSAQITNTGIITT